MTTHDQRYPATYPAAPTTVLPVHHEDPTPTVPAGSALPIKPTAVTPAGAPSAGPAKPTVEEFIGTLDGWDEQAIERAFGREYTDLGESMKSLRALAMILLKRRDELDHTRAYNAAMGLKTSALLELFDLSDEGDAAAALAAVMGGKAPSA